MGKSKKGPKSTEAEESDETQQVIQDEDKASGGRKSKKSESDDKPAKATSSKSKKKAKKVNDDDDENDDDMATQTVSAFDLLNIDDSDDGAANEVVEEDSKKSKKKKSKPANDDAPAKKDKKKKKKAEEEDWDSILAEYQDEGSAPVAATNQASEEVDTKKKKKTKGESAPQPSINDTVTESAPVKDQAPAATKKKDKKKKNKADDAATNVETESAQTSLPEATTEVQSEKTTETESAAAKKKKGPGKAMVAAMQEALKKKKEDEERMLREEEEKIRLIEQAERMRQERERLELEKKELKKQKEKERKERLKAEGKLLSAKQKADKARAELLLKSLREQGVDVPEIGEKRDARPSARSMRASKQKKEIAPPPSEVIVKEEPKIEQPAPQEQQKPEEVTQAEPMPPPPPVVEEIKDSWDVSSGGEEDDEDDNEDSVEQTSEEKVEGVNAGESDENEESGSEDSDSSDDEDSGSSSDEKETPERRHVVEKDPPDVRIRKREMEAEKKRSVNELRAAVVCVLGHVDTGKTKILDKLRRTNVQDGEAGGITQQIGATNVPIENIKENTKYVKGASEVNYKVPGLLIIDTPGHESFSNLRNRGSSLCDIAILVVDIMHGLEPQTIESLNLLKSRKTPFVVALNKIDRLYDWNTMQRKDVQDIIKAQSQNTQNEFEKRKKEVILQFNEQGLNAALYYENTDPRTFVSLVPTSAITGEGMGNLLMLIVQFSQNQLAKRLAYSEQLQATVLEVKAIQGMGTTIDAILINGKLREGDTMIVAGTDGPIVTQIRGLHLPHPMKELRVKNNYIEQKEIRGAQGVKISAKELEKAIAGINLQIAQEPDEVEYFKNVITNELKSVLRSIKLSDHGVFVQASTLGSLEALLEFLKTSKIPYAGIRIGPVVKRDVMKASIMLEHQSEYATILAFDVKIERDAQELADNLGVKIFQADIIYHLFDKFMAYREELKQQKRDQFKSIAVFPCKLKILPQFIFNSRDPIVMGVMVEAGIVKEGTPICVIRKKDDKPEVELLGIVASIESNHKTVPTARKGLEVCIKIEPVPGEAPKMFGRHFDENDMLVSRISRESIDACKDYFRDELVKTDWTLMIELKNAFGIM